MRLLYRKGIIRLEEQPLLAFFGCFGRKEIGDFLIVRNRLIKG